MEVNDMDKNQKAPKWILRFFLALVIIGILILVFHFRGDSLSKITRYQSAEANSKVWNQDHFELNLVPGVWSEKVEAPEVISYRIGSSVDAKICFQDGFCSNIGPSYKDTHHEIWRGIFRLRSDHEGRATITVKH